jgi:hypothetical protein
MIDSPPVGNDADIEKTDGIRDLLTNPLLSDASIQSDTDRHVDLGM